MLKLKGTEFRGGSGKQGIKEGVVVVSKPGVGPGGVAELLGSELLGAPGSFGTQRAEEAALRASPQFRKPPDLPGRRNLQGRRQRAGEREASSLC